MMCFYQRPANKNAPILFLEKVQFERNKSKKAASHVTPNMNTRENSTNRWQEDIQHFNQ